jgi:hypothetical protein
MNSASVFHGDHEHFGFGETLPGTEFTGLHRANASTSSRPVLGTLALKAREDSVEIELKIGYEGNQILYVLPSSVFTR